MKMFKNHPSLREKRSNPTSPCHHQDCHGITCLAKTIRRIVKSEAGYALPLALILLLFGGFFVVPCLNLLYTSLNANIMVDERDLELYAADAGVEYGLWHFGPDAGIGLPAQGEDPLSLDLPETVNDRTVTVTIANVTAEGDEEESYKIESTALSADGDSTTVESCIFCLDFSWFFDSAITSLGGVDLDPNTVVIGGITSPSEPTNGTYDEWTEDTGLGDIWPDVDVLSDYYLGQGNLTPYSSSSIDIKDTKSIGGIKTDGSLSIDNTGSPDTLQLTETIYVTGNLAFEQPGKSHAYTIDLNGQTIFAYDGNSEDENKATITFASGCTIIGSGCIIAEGDITFSPNIGTGDKLVGVTDSTVDSSALANTFVLSQFTAESDGTVTTFNVECSGSGNVKVAIYQDDGGEPGVLLNAVEESQAVEEGWNTITFPDTNVTEDSNYWLAANSNAGIIAIYNEEPSNSRNKTASYSDFEFPNPAGTGFTSEITEQYAFACYSAGAPPGFVFIMSIEGMSYISPTKGSLYGSIAGSASVELKGKATLELIDQPDDGLNFPGSGDSGDSSNQMWIIDTYTID